MNKLFRAYAAASKKDASTRANIYAQLATELTIHAQLEEELVYPAAMAIKKKDAQEDVFEALEEHAIVKTLISQLDRMSPDDPSFDAKVTVLHEAVEHHVAEEEKTMFPNLERDLPSEELNAMGIELEERKAALMDELTNGMAVEEQRPHAP